MSRVIEIKHGTWKTLTVQEPYASLISRGFKHYETRSWKTNYRGKILIHTGMRPYKNWWKNENLVQYMPFTLYGMFGFFYGSMACEADLVDCVEITDEFIASLSEQEKAYGFYTVGRYAWKLENIKPVNRWDSYKGKLGLWNFEGTIEYLDRSESDCIRKETTGGIPTRRMHLW